MASDVSSDYVHSLPTDVIRKRYYAKTSIIGCDPHNIAATGLEKDVTKVTKRRFPGCDELLMSQCIFVNRTMSSYNATVVQ